VTPPEISDALPTKFTPANFAFAIWSVIYTFASLLVYYDWTAFGISNSLWSAIMILIVPIISAAVVTPAPMPEVTQ